MVLLKITTYLHEDALEEAQDNKHDVPVGEEEPDAHQDMGVERGKKDGLTSKLIGEHPEDEAPEHDTREIYGGGKTDEVGISAD